MGLCKVRNELQNQFSSNILVSFWCRAAALGCGAHVLALPAGPEGTRTDLRVERPHVALNRLPSPLLKQDALQTLTILLILLCFAGVVISQLVKMDI